MLLVIPGNNYKGDYVTILNSKTGFHVHATSRRNAIEILECAKAIEAGRAVKKASSCIRIRAMKLFVGGKVL